jgi:magnesium transporter
MISQRDQFATTSEAIIDLPGLSGSREHWRDIGDHLSQVTGELYRQTDDLGALTSTYFNANANRLNRLATRLTVLASFFLVWSFVSSFFGQNFGWLTDHIESLASFVIWMTVGLVIPSVLLAIYFWRRRREWL